MNAAKLFALLLIVCAVVIGATESSSYTPESRMTHEVFTSKVLKVYSLHEADIEYVAYVVQWREHEVVVLSDGLQPDPKKYGVGEVVRCRMTQLEQHSLQPGGVRKSRVIFSLAADVGPLDEESRLQAIAADVARRRAQRGAVKLPHAKTTDPTSEPLALPAKPESAAP